MIDKIWSWIEHNRFTIILTIVGLLLWLYALGCEPTTTSPITGGRVNARQLQLEYDNYINSFNACVDDLQLQAERQEKLTQILISLASGQVTSFSGLVQILLASGILGVGVDNVRKSAVIAGMKINKT